MPESHKDIGVQRKCGNPSPEQITAAKADQARRKYQSSHGPGAHLHQLIKTLTGQGITEACKCKSRIAQMNTRGPTWCRDNTETIIDWLIEEVDRRLKAAQDAGEPASWRLRFGGLELPGRRLALRQIILQAVRLAEKDADNQPEIEPPHGKQRHTANR